MRHRLNDFEFVLPNGKVIFGDVEAVVSNPSRLGIHTIELGKIDARVASKVDDYNYENFETFDQFEFEKANPELWSLLAEHLIDLVAGEAI